MSAGRVELTVPVDVAAPAEAVWAAVTDWAGQGDWMLGTRVEVTGGDGRSVGSTLRAVTGVGPLGVPDTMEITEWTASAPGGPFRCVVRHTGAVVRGDGVFEVAGVGPDRSRFLWSELLELPLGALGRAGWPLVRPAFRAGVAYSLGRLARQCEAAYQQGRAH
ncbi:SRPBCC family protein [Pseudonocardia acidicola]|uniref:SRPBCC family protein n=1 Tax=Pseudonocardia acidicola TaxID=2724939 RepID=A0ABX1SK87_9PSEU|nr:SRPBCC family protein [Pseudonocardia acidicola]NMI00685.1 SRPBCC family protein [Pseudonocardia acidicola]